MIASKVVCLRQAVKQYGFERYALRNVSFEVDRGELVYITGMSGAGKSTLLKLLFGMEQVSSGQVYVNSQELSRISKRRMFEYRRGIGFVFQDFKLLNDLTVFENVSLPLDIKKMTPKDVSYRVNGVLSLVGLSDRGRDYPRQLSGGEQQRVAIARSIVSKPYLLLADEPTGNLDSKTAREIMALFQEIRDMGTTVLIATHDDLLLEEFPSRTIILENGIMISDREGHA